MTVSGKGGGRRQPAERGGSSRRGTSAGGQQCLERSGRSPGRGQLAQRSAGSPERHQPAARGAGSRKLRLQSIAFALILMASAGLYFTSLQAPTVGTWALLAVEAAGMLLALWAS